MAASEKKKKREREKIKTFGNNQKQTKPFRGKIWCYFGVQPVIVIFRANLSWLLSL